MRKLTGGGGGYMNEFINTGEDGLMEGWIEEKVYGLANIAGGSVSRRHNGWRNLVEERMKRTEWVNKWSNWLYIDYKKHIYEERVCRWLGEWMKRQEDKQKSNIWMAGWKVQRVKGISNRFIFQDEFMMVWSVFCLRFSLVSEGW